MSSPHVKDSSFSKRNLNFKQTHSFKRDPYFIQIGLDFGTMFSKVICRDVATDKAWVHVFSRSNDPEFPFLIPSTLLIQKGILKHLSNIDNYYPEHGLYHLKLAVQKVALCQWQDSLLQQYRKLFSVDIQNGQLKHFVIACAVYYLGSVLGDVKHKIKQRYPDFGEHSDDYIAVNMAIPVADAEQAQVGKLYHSILCKAWSITDLLAGHFQIDLRELRRILKDTQKVNSSTLKDSCYIYPEVSANVQGFVRSRVSTPGVYLFSDTGAGSVDQSVFIFMRENQRELLSYLHGSVLPLGSSHIEQIAARIAADRGDNRQSLEYWRIKKESGESDPILESAKNEIAWKLCQGTETTLTHARRRLYVRDQLFQIRIIFGGGGHCKHPYETGTMRSFQGRLFTRPIKPDIVGLPSPSDLEKPFQQNWFKRLSVAYGLSFIKAELTPFRYPQENEEPKPQEIWQPKKALSDAPTKDQC